MDDINFAWLQNFGLAQTDVGEDIEINHFFPILILLKLSHLNKNFAFQIAM